MDKKSILALALIFIVFWLSNQLIWKKKEPHQVPETNQEIVQKDVQTPETPLQTNPETRAIDPAAGSIFPNDSKLNPNISISNDNMTLIFSNLGGVLKKVYLDNYNLSDQVSTVNLIPEDETLLGITVKTVDGDLDLNNQLFSWKEELIDGYQSLLFSIENKQGQIVEIIIIIGNSATVTPYYVALPKTEGIK